MPPLPWVWGGASYGTERMMGRQLAGADAAGGLVEALGALLPAGSGLALAWTDGAGAVVHAAVGTGSGAALERAGRRAAGEPAEAAGYTGLDLLWEGDGVRV